MATRVRPLVGGGQIFFCPGCKSPHAINTNPTAPRWTFNGDQDRPTFTPSILVTCGWSHVDPAEKDDVCHSFVTDGRFQFLGDCTHAMAGQTVDVPEWPYPPGSYGGIEEAE